ncbi:hypothetical protein PMZ80_010572 [Knufia obscura]|uniref:Tyrosinase copper-binding domain-containing protein n=1 Tax=Knufia obscura TaxID=1635080 RepID=A0ABR0R9J5_9EURO|nr:hypothetical protein PMZ80_010572 [Knufia obscura]
MHFSTLFTALAAVLGAHALPAAEVSSSSKYTPASTFSTDLLAAQALITKGLHSFKNGWSDNSQCSPTNVAIRREWSSLSLKERKSYIDAMLCLQSKPSKGNYGFNTNGTLSGIKTRYDDFVAVHINQTLEIHATASFLPWHRYFTWNLEQALRNECGYEGYQPYWNWGKYAQDPINSPLFDGSEYSMSGNGQYAEHNCTDALGNGINCIPPGEGGGCVTTGPFKDYTVNLGPLFPGLRLTDGSLTAVNSSFEHNPRCLRRDINPWVSSQWSTDAESFDLIKNYKNITTFQNHMQGDFPNGFFGVHSAGHYTIGGDPGGDFFVSPAEPAFYLHHAQIDRTWWMWQNLDPANRINAYDGPTIVFDETSPRGKLTDNLNMGNLGTSRQAKEVMDTTHGPLCYIYV